MNKILISTIAVVFLCAGICFASKDTFIMKGVEIPVIDGLVAIEKGQKQSGDAKIITYKVRKSFEEVCAYYEDFFRNNGFSVIGGIEADVYNVSAKKGDCMFTLRIFAENENTTIQFIW